MPGLVIFKRRWSVASDDLVVPATILLIIHLIWLIILSTIAIINDQKCLSNVPYIWGYIVILIGCVVVEKFIIWLSMRGSILNTGPRSAMKYLIYIRIGIIVIEIVWMILTALKLRNQAKRDKCYADMTADALLGITVCNLLVFGIIFITIWCTYDAAGRSWVKMKVYQNSLKEGQSKFRYRRSGNSQRNWRHRIAVREYQDSWDRRCRLLFCCIGNGDRQQNSFTEIAKLLSEFFRDLDVVPSDVIAGLILLRRQQRLESRLIVDKRENNTFQFLSGVAVTSNTKFLDVNHPVVAEEIQTLIHFLHYGLAVYGWPIFMMMNSTTGCCQLLPNMKCSQSSLCCLNCWSTKQRSDLEGLVVEDNCCQCNYSALKNMCQTHNYDMIYTTYHVAIGEPPFFVALDYDKKAIVISVRGTLSLSDIITDLNAEGELLPTDPIHEDWLAHKGMVEAALYIRNKLKSEDILSKALNFAPERGSQTFNIVLVGHSLGAGTAAILSILLKQEFPDLICFAFAPPGGLLSAPALEYTKEFIISVVLGKDVVPRLGLHQMENLRFDLINAIKQCSQPKWKVIGSGALCCCPDRNLNPAISSEDISESNLNKELTSHPIDDSIALTVHSPLYPPGRIIHIVRNHPKKSDIKYESKWRRFVGKNEPVFQALWADNTNFNQILISPVMIQDHMPDKMLEALQKLLIHTGPAKPQRKVLNNNSELQPNRPLVTNCGPKTYHSLDIESPKSVVIETCFTDSPLIAQNTQNAKRFANRSVRPTQLMPSTDPNKVDFMRDDWMGAAPLASPETLSDDTSSISSRSTGVRVSWAALPVFTVNERQFDEQKVVTSQPSCDSEPRYSRMSNEDMVSRVNDELNIPVVENDIQMDSNINTIEKNKNLNDNRKSLNLNFNSLNNKTERIDENNGLFGLLEVKDENYNNASSHSSDNNVQDLNSGEILNSRCESSNENECLQPLHRFSSDTDLDITCDPKPQPLRRSHEEIHLNNLDDTSNVFECQDFNINAEQIQPQNHSNQSNSGEMSPTLQMLFHKLLTIESPTTESVVNQTTCDSDVNANQISSRFGGNQF